MTNQRELVRRFTVGEYSFDMKINRQLALDAFKVNKKFWHLITSNADKGLDVEKSMADIDTFAKLLEQNDEMDELRPAFCEYILPRMTELAGETVDTNAFFEYCEENGVLDEVYSKILEFAMLGFSVGRSEQKKPKVKVTLE